MADDRQGVESPQTGKRVRMDGRSEEFVVLRVDAERLTVDLRSVGQGRQLMEDVPWLSLQAIRKPKPKLPN